MTFLARIIIGLLWLISPITAFSQSQFGVPGNLVGNGSFESLNFNPDVDLSPWVWGGCLGVVVNETGAAVGSNYASVCGLIYQDVPTAPGQDYAIRFAFGGHEEVQVNAEPLHITWGTEEIATIPITPVYPHTPQWRYLEFRAVAEKSTMRLTFSSYPLQAFPYIDDVSVILIPEPGVSTLLILLIVVGKAYRLTRR